MDILVSTESSVGSSDANPDGGSELFHIENDSDHPEQGSVVILRSNPLVLPMVCGLCGSQYATARELEGHLDMHREGLPPKRGRGRPKGSKAKRVEGAEDMMDPSHRLVASVAEKPGNVTETGTGLNADDSDGRRSQRPIKKASSDVYVQDENELDNLLRVEDPYCKQNLPQFTSDGVQIARLEDYVTSQVIVLEKQSEDLNQDGMLESTMDVSAVSSLQQATAAAEASSQDLDESLGLQAEEAMEALMNSNDLPATTESDETNMNVQGEVSEGNGNEGNVTHIEVCLETHKEDCETTGSSDVQAKTKMCELCCVVLPTEEMRQHMMSTHMKGSNQEFHCPRLGCNQLFSTIPRLRLHLSEHHQPLARALPARVYPCLVPDCNTIHKSKHALKLHMSDVHSALAEVSTSCNICNKVFKSKRAQSSHMKAHTKALEPVRCEKCFKEFRHPSALKFHMSMMPNCDKPKYVCTICGYKAVTPWRLNSHQKQVHSTNRPYTCEFCHKTYKTNEMLRQHTYKLHTGTPSFECDVCHKKFFYAAELREHSQLHSTTKQFVCPICHRAFKTMHVFRGHMNGKHSDTWYSCGFCKFTTSHKKSMKRHMVLVHKLKNVTLEVTPEEPQHQQVEVIQADGELHSIQLSDTGQVINSIQHMQYEDVGSVVIQNSNGELIAHEQLTGEVIDHGQMSGEIMSSEHIREEQMDDSFRQLITNHQQTVDGTMNASEVSEVLVSLSGAVDNSTSSISAPATAAASDNTGVVIAATAAS